MLKNNKGFTVVELVTSFALAMVVFAFLFEIVVSLKDLYINSGYKTELLYKQAMMSNKINNTLLEKKIKIAMTCGDDCLFFVFDDSTTSKLQIDKTNNLFTWGDYTTNLVTNSSFGDIYISSTTNVLVGTGKNNSIINIQVPITSANIEGKDFGINIVYQYDSRVSSITGMDSNVQTDGTKAVYLNGAVDDIKLQGSNYVDPGYFVYYADGHVVFNDPSVTVTGTPTDVLGDTYTITYSIVEESVTVATITRNVTVVGTYTYNYTGDVQTFTAPIDGYYKVELWGASGGGLTTGNKGLGGYTSGNIYLTVGTTANVYVGGQGSTSMTNTSCQTLGGGYNGGGNVFTEGSAGAGGGATDIRFNGTSLADRVIIAGAGGGGGKYDSEQYMNGGFGGGIIGGAGTAVGWNPGLGGTQNSGGIAGYYGSACSNPNSPGSFGQGGNGSGYYGGGGSGGGGYYGGGGGFYGGGGGGSSFISGYAGVNAIISASTVSPSNNTKHFSNNYFINGTMQIGVNEGNGKATITYIGKNIYKQNSNLNGVRYVKDCINGNSVDSNNQWVELQAIVNGTNVAYGKTITGTVDENASYPYARITDGNITSSTYAQSSSTGLQCVTVDLEEIYNLDEVAVWHNYEDGRTYTNHTLSVSLNNTDWLTVINSSVAETQLGQRYNAYISG